MEEHVVRVGVGVLVLDGEGRVLLGKRKSKLGESTYSLPGGHLEFGETPGECARRELLEETSLMVGETEVISVTNDIAYGKHYVTLGVLVKNYEGVPRVCEPDKCEGWDWYPFDRLPEPLFAASAAFLDNYLSKRFYK